MTKPNTNQAPKPQPATQATQDAEPVDWARVCGVLLIAHTKLTIEAAEFRGDMRTVKHLKPALAEAEELVGES